MRKYSQRQLTRSWTPRSPVSNAGNAHLLWPVPRELLGRGVSEVRRGANRNGKGYSAMAEARSGAKVSLVRKMGERPREDPNANQ